MGRSRQLDMSRVPDRSVDPDATTRSGPTITVSTSYIASPVGSHAYFETAARRDGKTPALCGPWVIVEQYTGQDQALAGHAKWRDRIRTFGLPHVDMFGNDV